MVDDAHRSGAPGVLEDIRTLVNSWSIPNDTRVPQDELAQWISDSERWRTRFGTLPVPRTDQIRSLVALRDAVRAALSGDFTGLQSVIADHPPGIALDSTGIAFVPRNDRSASDSAIAIVLTAAAEGQLQRLRTCGDCGWAFYDSSRNNRRRWCAMDPAPGGRGCGSAAKSRSYRARRQAV